MIYTGKERRQLFELSPKSRQGKAFLVDKRRTLIGSSESCDVVLKFSDISPIHAILEFTKEGARIYDLNTPSGTYLNGKKVVLGEYKEGDFLSFGSHEYVYKKYVPEESPPPILDMLNPIAQPKLKQEPVLPSLPRLKGVKIPAKEFYAPRIAYPLAEDPRADYSGFIYEETEKLYPIFKYEYEKNSVEVLIHFGQKIYSVDFLPPRKGRYRLVGMGKDIEFPILGKEERVDFLEISKRETIVFPPVGYEILALNDQKKTRGSILLEDDDLLIFSKGQTKIFVRKTPPPPKVAVAPFFQRGGNFSKVLIGVYAVVIMLLYFISGINVEETKKKQEEKAPERIAKILYKSPVEVKPVETPPPPKPIEIPLVKGPEKPAVPTSPLPGTSKEQIVQIKKADVTEFEAKRPPKTPPQKGVPPQSKTEIKKSLITKTVTTKKGLPPPPKTIGRPAPIGTVIARKSFGGNVETFKLDFKPNISKVLQKGESFASGSDYGTPPGSATSDEEIGIVGGVGAGGAGTVKKAEMGSRIGSLSGATRGSLDTATGVSGLSDKESIYTVGIPGKTVILGGMDPDVIKRILVDNLNLIQSCYQREIEEDTGSFSGVVKVRFVIGASGRVSEASASSNDRSLTQKVKGCIVGVIRDIKFPRPPFGGTIEVVQPFNLQSAKRG